MMRVYVRKDLKMNKGKTIAQISHAAMKYALSAFSESNGVLSINESELKRLEDWRNEDLSNIEIVTLNSEEELLVTMLEYSGYAVSIIDNGLTYFNGVKTMTCVMVDTSKSIPVLREPEYGLEECDTKQVIVYDSSLGTPKIEQYRLSVKLALDTILSKVVDFQIDLNLNENQCLKQWLYSCFKKVTLKTKDSELLVKLIEEASLRGMPVHVSSINDEVAAIAIGASQTRMFNGLTDKLTLY